VQVIEIDNAEFSYEKVVVGALRPVVIAYGTQWYSVMSSSRARRTHANPSGTRAAMALSPRFTCVRVHERGMRCDAMGWDAVRCGGMRWDAVRRGGMRWDAHGSFV
jgi:hypothetical protein